MIKASIRLDNPDEQPITVRVTMPLSEWKRLREQITSSVYPSCRLHSIVNKLVNQAEKSLFEESEFE